METQFKAEKLVHVNLAGMQIGSVAFHAAVTDAVGNVVNRTATLRAPEKASSRHLHRCKEQGKFGSVRRGPNI
jgi:hypothetical protein